MKRLILTILVMAAFSANAQKVRISNARLVQPYNTIENATILIENGKIVEVATGDKAFPGAEQIDAKGNYVSAGFIDLHCHGGGGHDFSDGTVEALLGAAQMHAQHGTTLILPTTASCSNEILFDFFEQYRKADKLNAKGAAFGGVHIEGGYFNHAMKGGQDPRYIRNPTPADYNAILAKGGDIIVRWSFAPELEGAQGLAQELARRGIQMSIAHTAALYEEAVAGFNWGMTSITHFYSLTSTVTRRDALRYAGVIEAGYAMDDMFVEAIADGVHLPSPLLRLIYKGKGADRIALVTDAMRGAGMPEGPTILGSLKDGVPAIIEDGVAKLPDRSSFAGSVATADRLVRTYIEQGGVELNKAVEMMTLTPARLMKIEDRKGSIEVGKDADIVIFDKDINIQMTMIGGKKIYVK